MSIENYGRAQEALVEAETRDESEVSSLSSMSESEALVSITQSSDNAMAEDTTTKESSDVEMDGPEVELALPAEAMPEIGRKPVAAPGCGAEGDVTMGEEAINPLPAPVVKGISTTDPGSDTLGEQAMSNEDAKPSPEREDDGGSILGDVAMHNTSAGPLLMPKVDEVVNMPPPGPELAVVREPTDVDMVDVLKPTDQQPSTPLVTAKILPEVKPPVSSRGDDVENGDAVSSKPVQIVSATPPGAELAAVREVDMVDVPDPSAPESEATPVVLEEVGGDVPGSVMMGNAPAGPLPMLEVGENASAAPPDTELTTVREPCDVDMVDTPKLMDQQPSTPLVAAEVLPEVKPPVSSRKDDVEKVDAASLGAGIAAVHELGDMNAPKPSAPPIEEKPDVRQEIKHAIPASEERQRSSERDPFSSSDKSVKHDPGARDVTGRDSELFAMEVADDIEDLGVTKRKTCGSKQGAKLTSV